MPPRSALLAWQPPSVDVAGEAATWADLASAFQRAWRESASSPPAARALAVMAWVAPLNK